LQNPARTVGIECPFAKIFNTSGKGEGLAWKATRMFLSEAGFWFETKGLSFAVTAYESIPKSKNVEMKERTRIFAEAVVTAARLEEA